MIEVDGKRFKLSYYPFFRIKSKGNFAVFGMRLPSGQIKEVLVFNDESPIVALKEYCQFLVKEYVLEDDIMLTPKALELKTELMELFNELD